MLVVPPPPKYSQPPPNVNVILPGAFTPPTLRQPAAATTAAVMAASSLETNNSLSHPQGPEYQLVVGEGTYTLRDDLRLAIPPPHPSETPLQNQNPLSTAPTAPTTGVKLSLATIAPKKPSARFHHLESAISAIPSFGSYGAKDVEKEPRKSQETASSDAASSSQTAAAVNGDKPFKAPAFGADNTLLQPPGGATATKDASKRKKPKTNMSKTNSSYISRVVSHEAMNKRLQDRVSDGTFAFANVNRAFEWLDFTTPSLKAEHLTKILFTKAHMLCHDVNPLTRGFNHLDVVAGSSAADIMWYEPFSQRYNRINKNGVISAAAVSEIRWIPGSETLFLASHVDGTLIVYDKEREDAVFVPEEEEQGTRPKNGLYYHHHNDETAAGKEAAAGGGNKGLHVNKSVNSKNQKTNPVAYWKISNQRINGFAFSPDARHLAVVSEDGSLRIIDYLKETLLDQYTSYYGGLICVCWSPDGKYVLTGGQDDLVSIWSLADRQIVARCPGHHSWVTAVAFDPWRCDDDDSDGGDGKNYRFGSVGEDCRLLLWDFNVGMLHKPRAAAASGGSGAHSRQQRDSVSSVQPPRSRSDAGMPAVRLRSNSSLATASTEGEDSVEHAVESRTRTADLPPVMSKVVDPDPLSWLGFQEDCIITACASGHIRTWDRPKESVKNVDGNRNATPSGH